MTKTPKKQKIFVLDTNIFLLNPDAINTFDQKGNTIVVPLTVLQELDGLKKNQRTGYEARSAARSLEKLICKKGANRMSVVTLTNGAKFILDPGNLSADDFSPLNTKSSDDQIIATAKKYKRTNKESRVVLISNDTLVRIKATSQNIAAEEFEAVNFGKNGVDDLYCPPQYIAGLNPDEVQNLNTHGYCVYEPGDSPSHHQGYLMDCGEETDPQALLRSGNKLRYIKQSRYAYLQPRNAKQALAMYLANQSTVSVLVLVGPAGTGKTIIALESGIKRRRGVKNEKIYIFRPTDQAGEDLGFLPGSLDEKMAPYKKAIGDAYQAIQEYRKTKDPVSFDAACHLDGFIKILPVNYVRGTTINNATVIIDEAQNFSDLQMKTLLTRIGENVNVIITGDPDQIDNRFLTKKSCGLTHVIGKLRGEPIFAHITLDKGERSEIASLAADLL